MSANIAIVIGASATACSILFGFIIRAGRTAYRQMAAHAFLRRLQGQAVDGHPAGPDIIEQVTRVDERLRAVELTADEIRRLVAELKPNGGTSWRDEYRADQARNTAALDQVAARLDALARRRR